MFGSKVSLRSVSPALLLGSALALAGIALPAHAQDDADARLKKVESEVRALQRKVFPGGDGKYFAPEITAPATAATPSVGQPATTPVSDILVRMDALEAQMARLTGEVEHNTNRIAQIEAKLAAAPVAPTEPMPLPTVPAPTGSGTGAATGAGVMPGPKVATTVPAPTPSAAPSRPVAVADARVEGVKAIVKPQTGDAGDDEYSYGYRLWEAKYYPEAEQQLKLFLSKYPKHARASWGRNLLGRAYLDDGQPEEAAKWFLQNYQADKTGDRAPDSLLYLAVSLKQMKDTKRSCIALGEFGNTYVSEAYGRLKGLYDTTRNGLSCA